MQCVNVPWCYQRSAAVFYLVPLPDGAGGGRQWRAKRPDVLFVLLHGGNADLEGGDVGQQRPRGQRGLLPFSLLLRLQQRHKLDLDDSAGKTKHAPRKAASGEEAEEDGGEKTNMTDLCEIRGINSG